MGNARKRDEQGFDKSHISISTKLRDGDVHSDYLAHCFRWSFAVNHIGKKTSGKKHTVLDFGCGQDIPLYCVIAANGGYNTLEHYYGVDLNKITVPSNRVGTRLGRTLMENTNILDVTKEMVSDVTTVTSFEVFEHCPPEFVEPILKHLHSLADDEATFIYSTPTYKHKVGAAKNHINEMTRDCFGWLLEETGHTVVENYGTFGSQQDYKKHLTECEMEMFNKLNKYHSAGVISNIFAPLYPQYARNNIWVCKKRKDGDERLFPTAGQSPRSQNGYWDNV